LTREQRIEGAFPGLRTSPWEITSPRDERYNCVGWAAGRSDRRWWPSPSPGDWPADLPSANSVESLIALFARLGYVLGEPAVRAQSGERIAIFGHAGRPTHVARQLGDGRWTSKLGAEQDIVHELRAIEGEVYGSVVALLARHAVAPLVPSRG